MKATVLPPVLSPAVSEFLDELAQLIVEDILEDDDRARDECAGTSQQGGT